MRTFEYTSRDKDGRLKRGTVQAADRAGAMREVRAGGGVPLSVSEARRAPGASAAGWRRALPWAALAVPVAVAGLWLLRGGSPGPAPVPGPDGGAPPRARAQRPVQEPGGAAGAEGPEADSQPARQGGGGAPPADAPPAAARTGGGAEAPPGEAPGAVSDVFLRNMREPLFRREAEQMLALYVEPGRAVPPTPFGRGFEEDALAALAEDIVVTAEDPPEDAERKELVAWMKDDMRGFLAGGGTVAEFFALMERRQEEEAELLSEARRILHGLAREGDREGALDAHRALNEVLAEKGIAPLPLPGLLRRAVE